MGLCAPGERGYCLAGSATISSSDDTVHSTVSRILTELRGSHEALWLYCGDQVQAWRCDRNSRHYGALLALTGFEPRDGLRLLDAGCGFGVGLIHYGYLGVGVLRGVDSNPERIDAVQRYLPLLPPWLRERMAIEFGDVTSTPYPAESFDVIVSNEALSHYRRVTPFFREARRLLVPGGALVIADGNNGLNPATRRRAKAIWHAFEHDTGATVHGHSVVESFTDKRRRIIREQFDLPEPAVERLAASTAHMNRAEIIAAVETFLASGALPRPPPAEDAAPLNPDSDQVMEQLYNPYLLGRELRAEGFRVEVRGYWGGGAGGKPVIRAANRVLAALSPLTMPTARQYRIVAWKH